MYNSNDKPTLSEFIANYRRHLRKEISKFVDVFEVSECPCESQIILQLRAIRHALGLTQTDIAEKLGCHVQTIKSFEDPYKSGRRVSAIQRYARLLGVEIVISCKPAELTDNLFDDDTMLQFIAKLEAEAEKQIEEMKAEFEESFGEEYDEITRKVDEILGLYDDG